MNTATHTDSAALADLDAEIQGLEAQERQAKERIASLRRSLTTSDEALTSGDLSDRLRRERARIMAQIAEETRQMNSIEQELQPLKDRRRQIDVDREASMSPEQVAKRMQGEIDAATRRLTTLEAKRPALVTSLHEVTDRRAEAASLEQAEQDAAGNLAKARADAFLLTPGTEDHEEAEGEIDAANVALAVAREKADTARAALPRLLALIDDRQGALDALDGEISTARTNLESRTLALKMFKARAAYNGAAVALAQAAGVVYDLDRDLGRRLFESLRYEGIRSIDDRGRLDVVQCLQRGVLAP